MVQKLNRVLCGWANYFCLGTLSPANQAINRHVRHRLYHWFHRKYPRSTPPIAELNQRLTTLGLVCLGTHRKTFREA